MLAAALWQLLISAACRLLVPPRPRHAGHLAPPPPPFLCAQAAAAPACWLFHPFSRRRAELVHACMHTQPSSLKPTSPLPPPLQPAADRGGILCATSDSCATMQAPRKAREREQALPLAATCALPRARPVPSTSHCHTFQCVYPLPAFHVHYFAAQGPLSTTQEKRTGPMNKCVRAHACRFLLTPHVPMLLSTTDYHPSTH